MELSNISDSTTRCHLFDIPIELRLVIYEDIIISSCFTQPDVDRLAYASSTDQYLIPLLNTCTQIRTEAARAYYARMHTIYSKLPKTGAQAMERWTWWNERQGPCVANKLDWTSQEVQKGAVRHYKKITRVIYGQMIMAERDMKEVRAGKEGIQKGLEGCFRGSTFDFECYKDL